MVYPRWCICILLLAFSCAAKSQELSPRSYWPAPAGTHILTTGYLYTSGDTLTDPSLPVTGINSDIHNAFAALFNTFNLFGRTSNFILELPYLWGKSDGIIKDAFEIDRDIDGLGDLSATLSVNLLGAPSMDTEQFAALRRDPHPILGVSLRVVAPTGDYNKKVLINAGTNRWATKLEVGYMYPLRPKWLFESEAGVWFFEDNDEFLGQTREQDPIYAIEAHLVRRFKPGFWGSLDINYYRGGQTTVDGENLDDLQRTTKYGATLVFPFRPGTALKVSYSSGSASGDGNDFDSYLVSLNQRL